MRAIKVILLLIPLLFSASCSQKSQRVLSLFFDIPPKETRLVLKEVKPPPVKEEARPQVEEQAISPQPRKKEEEPPIEKTLVWEEAEKLLPRDNLGEVDWMEAIRKGVIKPRASIDGDDKPFVFKFNFHFPGPSGLLGAYFPHSAHTQWLTCESCHPEIFPQRGTKLSMVKILSGEFCGKCHTTVAFPIAKGCRRCHRRTP